MFQHWSRSSLSLVQHPWSHTSLFLVVVVVVVQILCGWCLDSCVSKPRRIWPTLPCFTADESVFQPLWCIQLGHTRWACENWLDSSSIRGFLQWLCTRCLLLGHNIATPWVCNTSSRYAHTNIRVQRWISFWLFLAHKNIDRSKFERIDYWINYSNKQFSQMSTWSYMIRLIIKTMDDSKVTFMNTFSHEYFLLPSDEGTFTSENKVKGLLWQ